MLLRVLSVLVMLSILGPGILYGEVLDLFSTEVPMDVRPSGSAFRTTFHIPTEENGYALVVQQCQLGTHFVPISSSGFLIFNLAFDGEWITDTYAFHEGTLQGYYPVPANALLDNKVDISFVTFRLGSYGNLLDPDKPVLPGGVGVGYGSTRVENMWLRVWYTQGADIQPPTGSIRIQNDPAYGDRRHVLIEANVSDNSGQIAHMRYHFGDELWSDWVTYQSSRPIVLPEAEATTVFVQYRDAAGNAAAFSAMYDPAERLGIQPVEREHGGAAQAASFAVESNLDSWVAVSNTDWISVDEQFGFNDRQVSYSLTPNTDYTRNGQITVSGGGLTRTFSISQNHSGFSAGDGTPGNPYQVSSLIGLYAINDDLNAHYVLTTNLDLDGELHDLGVIAPYVISGSPSFTGSFDGNGYTIRNLTINGGSNSYLGLFGRIGATGEVRNLRLESTTVTGTADYYGVLAGHNAGTVNRCSATGTVSGRNYVGGLLGYNASGGELAYVRASVSVSATGHAGGLVGRTERGTVLFSHSFGSVNAASNVGGLVGSCDTTGDYRDVANFWDTQSSQQAASAMGSGRITAQMQTQSTFTEAGWDFAGEDANGIFDDWVMGDDGYPDLHLFSATYAVPVLSGSGRSEDPFRIAGPRDLVMPALNRFAHYRLANDLDLTGVTFHNRAVIPHLEGSFDGNGHAVHGLRILGGETDLIGFFGTIARYGQVYDLAIEKAQILGGRNSVGVLAGYNAGAIVRCSVSAEMRDAAMNIGGLAGFNDIGVVLDSLAVGSITGGKQIGGLVGWNGSGAIRRSRAAVTVTASMDNNGGLVGVNSGGMIAHCYAIGQVSGSQVIGGLVGYHQNGTISFCHASGSATATDGFVGGLVGHNQQGQVVACYSTGRPSGTSNVGGLVGFRAIDGNYLDAGNFWDTETSQIATSIMGSGRTTSQMQTQSTFTEAGWDFAGEPADGIHDDWIMPETGHPQLYVFSDAYQPRALPGAGTPDDPYLIEDTADLMAVRESDSAHYRLMSDLDLDGVTFGMQAVVPFFSGAFDGGGHAIRNLTVIGGGNNMLGLFGRLEPGSLIRNLRIENGSISGGSFIGALAGMSHGTIERCSASGAVSSSSAVAGGLVGGTGVSSIIAESSASVNLYSPGTHMGGLAGFNSGTIRDSYARGSLSGISYLGGLIGWNYQARVQRSYSTGRVGGGSIIGGLVGSRDTRGNHLDSANFWDTQSSYWDSSAMGAGRITYHMQTKDTFDNAGWDFQNVWSMPEMSQGAYPELRWQRPVIVFDPGGHGEIVSGAPMQQVTRGTAAVAPEVVPFDDYIFLGWNGPFDRVNQDVTLSAVYASVEPDDVIVTFRLDGKAVYSDLETGVYSTQLVQQIVPYEGGAVPPVIEPMEGWLFEGWDTDVQSVTKDLIVNAVFKAGWIVSFDLGGKGERSGGGELVQAVYEGQTAIAPEVDPFTGWVFTGWDTAFDHVTGCLHITARYAVATYTVNFHLDDQGIHTGGGDLSQVVPHGSAAVAPAVTALEGWVFAGWNAAFDSVMQDLTLTAQYREAMPGDIEEPFDPNAGGTVLALAVQPDGKILVGGSFTNMGGETRNRLARLNPDGSLDADFNPNAGGSVETLALQSDGKILVGGFFTSIGGQTRNHIALLNPDGSLDAAFNPNASYAVYAMAVQSDGKILIGGGFSSIGGQTRNRIARLNPDGSLDTDFNPNAGGSVMTLAVQPDGKIVVGGFFTSIGGIPRNRIARLNPDGSLDMDFNPNADGMVETLLPQADGKILLGGDFYNVGGMRRLRIARLNSDGTVDTGFYPNAGNSVHTLALQADGKILIGGEFTTMGGLTRNRIARLNPDGTPDRDFNPDAGGGMTYYGVTSLALQADGKILIGGEFTSMGGMTRNRIARLCNGENHDYLMVTGADTVEWLLPGAYPETARVRFDLSTDAGATWAPLGEGARMNGGWQRTGLDLPSDCLVRARAVVSNGGIGESLMESIMSFPMPAFTVQFDPGERGTHTGGGAMTQTVSYGGSAEAPRVATTEGWEHVGWDLELDRVTGDRTITALYEMGYQVVFVLDGKAERIGGGALKQVVPYGGSATAPILREYENWILAGWSDRFDAVNSRMEIWAQYRTALPGEHDTAFDPEVGNTVNTLAVQVDGRILLGGWFSSIGGVTRNRIARLNPDGTLDSDFNPNAGGTVNTLAAQPDGRILLGGWFSSIGGVTRNSIARLHPDGSLDAGFNPNAGGTVNTLAVQSDGKILVGGSFTSMGGVTRNRIARLNPDGSLDAEFDPNADGEVVALVLQPDGKILVGGGFTMLDGTPQAYMARINSDGTLDEGFSPHVEMINTWNPLGVEAIALRPDGKIYASGDVRFIEGETRRSYLVRLEEDGSLDVDFYMPPRGAPIDQIALLADGRLLVGADGGSSTGGIAKTHLFLLNENGSIDASFDRYPIWFIKALGLQSTGRLLIAGSLRDGENEAQANLLRLYVDEARSHLTVPDTSRIEWICGGAHPEALRVTFDLSRDGGETWSYLGMGTRTDIGWQLDGLDLPSVGSIRGRAVISHGGQGESLMEQTVEYPLPQFTVQFDLGEHGTRVGGGALNQTVSYGGAADEPQIAPLPGWAHVGWDAIFNRVTAGLIVTARYLPTYTVTFDLDSQGERTGGGELTQVVIHGRGANTPLVQGLELHVLGGWDRAFDLVTEDLSVTAWYHPPRTVTFDLAGQGVHIGGGALSQTVAHGGSAVAPAVWPDEGLVFLGWDVPFNSVQSDVTITARYRGPLAGDTTPFDPDPRGPVNSMALQPDGKILVCGSFTSVGGAMRNRIARLHPDGSVDMNFNPNASSQVVAMAVQPDGKILVGGSFSSLGGITRNRIARLNPDGALDPGFNPNADNDVAALFPQPDGKIVVGGFFTSIGGIPRNGIARLNPDGSPDMDFNPNANYSVYAMAVQSDGKMVIGGLFSSIDGQPRNSIARLNPDGSLDAAFNPNASGTVHALAIQSDGKILVGGWFGSIGGKTRNRIARLNPDGTLDMDFDPNAGEGGWVSTLAVQADGHILVGGEFTRMGGEPRNYIARLYPDGTLDNSFDPNAGGSVNSLVLQEDGGILVGGDFTSISGVTRLRLAQLLNHAASDELTVPGATKVVWRCNGAFPVAERVHFDLSTDDGESWVDLGPGERGIEGWTLSPIDLPASGSVRARAVVTDGRRSSGLVERFVNYSLPSHTVTFDLDGKGERSGGGELNQTVLHGGSATAPELQVLNGFVQIGWDLEFNEVTEDLTIRAQYLPTYTVTFDLDGKGGRTGGGEVVQTITHGGAAVAPTVEGVNLSVFGGWDVAFDYVTANLTVTAWYHPPCTVIFDLGEHGERIGGGELTQIVANGSGAVAPTLQTPGNWVFAGWNVTFDVVQSDLIVTARYNRVPASGTPDVSFNPNAGGSVYALATQPDGKILLGGYFTTLSGQARNRIARLNPDGTLDSSFNPNSGGGVHAFAVQPDGKIVVGGYFTSMGGLTRNRIARLNPDGSPDTSFNPNANESVKSLAVQADGKILVGGSFTSIGGQPRNRIARLNPDGTVDAGFNPNATSLVETMALQPDGKILVGGQFSMIGGQTRNRIARLNPDGTLDSSFNPDASSYVYALVVQADGKILAGGYFTSLGGQTRNRIARLNPDGTLDTGFNPNAGNHVLTIAAQSDGKILVGGRFTSMRGVSRNRIARLNPDGTLDTSFNPNAGGTVYSLIIQGDGNVLAGGVFTSIGGQTRNRIARLVNEEALDQLAVPSATRVHWQCGGAFPEAIRVSVDLSTDNGTSWAEIGHGACTDEGWELAGLNLPATGKIRARAIVTDGGKSSGLLERVEAFNLPEYSVIFDLGIEGTHNGGGDLSQTIVYGGAAISPQVHPLEGFAHVGWDTAFDEVSDDLTVTAMYLPTYTVTFDLREHGERIGGGALTQIVVHGSAAAAPDVSPQAGLGFAGWDQSIDSVTGNLTVTARYFTLVWSAIDETYTSNQPIPVMLTALEPNGTPFTDFTSPVDISAEMGVHRSGTRQIGTGRASWNYPMSTYYHDARTQVIYLSDEIGGAGIIRSIALDIEGVPGVGLNNWTLRMRHTSMHEYPDDPQWESGWITVHRQNLRIYASGWVVFELETPFEYNGIDNLMVDFSHDNDRYFNDGFCAATDVGSPRTLTFRTDSLHGEPTVWSSGEEAPTPGVSTRIPNIRFGGDWYHFLPLSVEPNEATGFENGVWTGTVTFAEPGTGGRLIATAADGTRWESDLFDVLQAWQVTFDLGEYGTHTGGGDLEQRVLHGQAATPPLFDTAFGWAFDGWDTAFDVLTDDLAVTALFSPLAGTFNRWIVKENLSGTPSEIFRQICPVRGVAHGFRYAFGANLIQETPLLNIRIVNGRVVVETPARDAATLPFVVVRIVGTDDLTHPDWTLPLRPAQDTTGKPAGREWHEPEGDDPDKVFYRLEVELK